METLVGFISAEEGTVDACKSENFNYLKKSIKNLKDTVSHLSEVAKIKSMNKEEVKSLNLHEYCNKAIYNVSGLAKNIKCKIENNVDPKHAASLPPITQRLVRKNPNTGAKNFYIGSHAKEIVGWNYDDSRSLLDELLAQTTVAERIYTHKWQPGDLVIWDNRCILHRGTGYDADKYRRFMRQTRVAGLGPTLEE